MKAEDILKEILDIQVLSAIAGPERQAELREQLAARKAQLVMTSKCSEAAIQHGIKRLYKSHANNFIDRILSQHSGETDPPPSIE